MPKVLSIKYTDADYAKLEEYAKLDNLPLAKWARRVLESRGQKVDLPKPAPKKVDPKPVTVESAKKMVKTAFPEGHSHKCTCLACNKARGWRG
jgi:hypothetical protein